MHLQQHVPAVDQPQPRDGADAGLVEQRALDRREVRRAEPLDGRGDRGRVAGAEQDELERIVERLDAGLHQVGQITRRTHVRILAPTTAECRPRVMDIGSAGEQEGVLHELDEDVLGRVAVAGVALDDRDPGGHGERFADLVEAVGARRRSG